MTVIGPFRAITVAGDLKAVLVGLDSATLVISETIATSGMLNDPDTAREMRDGLTGTDFTFTGKDMIGQSLEPNSIGPID